jgi:glycosyltransferase involved in cell wall biosynthesis
MPYYFIVIIYHILGSNYVHSRAPSSPAFLAILISFFLRNRVWWHKYAGNWSQLNAPLFYSFQRWLLKQNSSSAVTINGNFIDKPKHCLSFENPCINSLESDDGLTVSSSKKFSSPFNFCFVGRIEEEKGVLLFLQSLLLMPSEIVGQVSIVGDGPLLPLVRKIASESSLKVNVFGSLGRDDLNLVYKSSHFLVLPTVASEGFPKVIAEAANYGVVPVVTSFSGISYYCFHNVNSILLEINSLSPIYLANRILEFINNGNLSETSNAARLMSLKFTFVNFESRLKTEIFKDC